MRLLVMPALLMLVNVVLVNVVQAVTRAAGATLDAACSGVVDAEHRSVAVAAVDVLAGVAMALAVAVAQVVAAVHVDRRKLFTLSRACRLTVHRVLVRRVTVRRVTVMPFNTARPCLKL